MSDIKQKRDYNYILHVEQIMQKIHIKYTIYDIGYLITVVLIFLYFDTIDMAGAISLFAIIVYHRLRINKKREDVGELYLMKKLNRFKEHLRREFTKRYYS